MWALNRHLCPKWAVGWADLQDTHQRGWGRGWKGRWAELARDMLAPDFAASSIQSLEGINSFIQQDV